VRSDQTGYKLILTIYPFLLHGPGDGKGNRILGNEIPSREFDLLRYTTLDGLSPSPLCFRRIRAFYSNGSMVAFTIRTKL
jgi:hypothetical protein